MASLSFSGSIAHHHANSLAARRVTECDAKAVVARAHEHPALTSVLGDGNGEGRDDGLMIQIRLK